MPGRRTVQFKAWNVWPLIDILSPRHWNFPVLRISTAIAKFHNTEIGHFGHNAFIHELIRGSLNNTRISQSFQLFDGYSQFTEHFDRIITMSGTVIIKLRAVGGILECGNRRG